MQLKAGRDGDDRNDSAGRAILMAALALPGLIGVAGAAHADSAPEQGSISLNYLDYRDWQPGLDRIKVHTPAIDVLAPVAGVWAVQASLVSDIISGASPRYHTAISGASSMSDHRVAEDVGLTRYFPQGTINAGFAHSGENDYQSRAFSFGGSLSTEDKNTTGHAGIGVSNDTINPVNQVVNDAKKHTLELMLGVTQILTQNDIVQADLGHVIEQGYLSDPYKFLDNRPDERSRNTLLLRWNHHFEGSDGTGRFSYRYYTDTWEIRAHTFAFEYVQPFSQGWTVTPSARYYTQSAASFYFDPDYDPNYGPPVPLGYVFGSVSSPDQRLSAFGAATLGLKVEKAVARDVQISFKFEQYEQRCDWRLFGSGSPGLAPLYARVLQLGIVKTW
ncbi:MAG: DUF3570 domain-containing protein [Burkholderiaceae bacterium]|nr:DUF3570 domain-containing protein [Burkholderiaceae bacterium]